MTDAERKKAAEGKHERFMTIERTAVDVEKRTVQIALSSEEPVERWYGMEILDHSPGACDLSRMNDGAPMLWMHNWDEQVGVILSAQMDPDKKCRAIVQISRNALGEEKLRDITDGILRKVSVAYMFAEDAFVQEIDPATGKQAKDADGRPLYRIMQWQPYEVSFVTVPADNTVGVGRTKEDEVVIPAGATPAEPSTITQGGRTMEPEAPKAPLAPEDVKRLEAERVAAIEDIATRFASRIKGDMQKLKKDAVELGASVELFRGAVFTNINDGKPVDTPDEIGLSEKETKRYSLVRAIMGQLSDGDKIDCSFERECSDAVAKKLGVKARGILMPYEVQNRKVDGAKRDLLTSSATAAGDLVGTNLLAGSFIELLRNQMIAGQLGVTRLDGLVGNIAIPRQTGAGTFAFVAENNAPSETALAVDQVTMSPKEGRAYTDFSRRLMLQSTPSVEGLVTADLAAIAAIGIDLQVFHGAGTNAPTGLVSVSGVGTVSGAGFNWVSALEFFSDVASANAAVGALKFAMNPVVYASLMGREKATGYPTYILENGKIGPWDALYSNQITNAYIFFGSWAQAILGSWGGIDILVDPYTGGTAGTIRVIVYAQVDVAARHAGAFSICSDFA